MDESAMIHCDRTICNTQNSYTYLECIDENKRNGITSNLLLQHRRRKPKVLNKMVKRVEINLILSDLDPKD